MEFYHLFQPAAQIKPQVKITCIYHGIYPLDEMLKFYPQAIVEVTVTYDNRIDAIECNIDHCTV